MKYVLFIIGFLAIAFGSLLLNAANTVMHEIAAILCFLGGINAIGFAGVINALDEQQPSGPSTTE